MTTALPIEVKKIAYRQSAKDGLVITFAVHPNDMPAALAAAPIGARFMAALVEIGDDERPKAEVREPSPEQPEPAGVAPKERQPWHLLTPTAQACIRCQDPIFQRYVIEEMKWDWTDDDADKPAHVAQERNAATWVRQRCKVNSRSMLSTNKWAASIWQEIDREYLGWLQTERM